jgi:hypothetical protein
MEAELCPEHYVKVKPDRFEELDKFLKLFKDCDNCFNPTNEKSHQIYCCKSNRVYQKKKLLFLAAPNVFLSTEFSLSALLHISCSLLFFFRNFCCSFFWESVFLFCFFLVEHCCSLKAYALFSEKNKESRNLVSALAFHS